VTQPRSTRKPAVASKAAAARAEKSDEQRTLEFEGLTLILPPKLPFRVLKHIRAGGVEGDVAFLEEVMGPEQMEKIWDLDIDVDRGQELIVEVFAAFGTDSGE